MIYLDNAATTSPKPPSVIRAVTDAMRMLSANPGRGGHTPSVKAAEAVYRARRNIAEFFDVPNEENVIFTGNCTDSLNKVIKGVLRKGDHVVISPFEHNSVLRPLEKLRTSGMITYTVADIGDDGSDIVNGFRRALNENTRLIVCTHASNAFGVVMPVRQLCALAHSYGILFCLDAAQSAGVLPIDAADDGFDYICCPGHKGLYGPMGTGLLLVNNDSAMDTLIEGGTGSESASPLMPDYLPDRLESGTLNVPGIAGLNAGVNFVRSKGTQVIYSSELSGIQYAYKELSRVDRVRLFTPYPEYDAQAPVLSFQVDGVDSESVAGYLNDRFGIAVRAGLHCAPLAHRIMVTEDEGTVRISPSVFTTGADMMTLVKAVKIFAHTM